MRCRAGDCVCLLLGDVTLHDLDKEVRLRAALAFNQQSIEDGGAQLLSRGIELQLLENSIAPQRLGCLDDVIVHKPVGALLEVFGGVGQIRQGGLMPHVPQLARVREFHWLLNSRKVARNQC